MNLGIGCHCVHTGTLANLVLSFAEVIVELLNELLTFLKSLQMPLTSGVPLVLNHLTALVRAGHLHYEAGSFDFCLV